MHFPSSNQTRLSCAVKRHVIRIVSFRSTSCPGGLNRPKGDRNTTSMIFQRRSGYDGKVEKGVRYCRRSSVQAQTTTGNASRALLYTWYGLCRDERDYCQWFKCQKSRLLINLRKDVYMTQNVDHSHTHTHTHIHRQKKNRKNTWQRTNEFL